MSKAHKLLHVTHLPIRWGDMDAYGHVNNTVYFRYAEQARCEWLSKIGCIVGPVGVAPVIINASCTFFKPMTHPGTVEVRMLGGEPGRSSLETFYEMRLVGGDELYCDGAAKIVWTDVETGKSAPIPDNIRALLG
jgi:acyl-CoA thioester hydrolase